MIKRFSNGLLILGSLWMILLCVGAYLGLRHPRNTEKWKQEPPPPEAISLLRLGEAGEVLAETPEGSLYEYRYAEKQPWQKVTQPSGTPSLGYHCDPSESNYSVVSPPGKVLSWVKEICVYAESAYYFEMVLLENGEIWSWQFESYAYTQMAIGTFLFIGLVVGAFILLLGAGLKIYQKVRKV